MVGDEENRREKRREWIGKVTRVKKAEGDLKKKQKEKKEKREKEKGKKKKKMGNGTLSCVYAITNLF